MARPRFSSSPWMFGSSSASSVKSLDGCGAGRAGEGSSVAGDKGEGGKSLGRDECVSVGNDPTDSHIFEIEIVENGDVEYGDERIPTDDDPRQIGAGGSGRGGWRGGAKEVDGQRCGGERAARMSRSSSPPSFPTPGGNDQLEQLMHDVLAMMGAMQVGRWEGREGGGKVEGSSCREGTVEEELSGREGGEASIIVSEV